MIKLLFGFSGDGKSEVVSFDKVDCCKFEAVSQVQFSEIRNFYILFT